MKRKAGGSFNVSFGALQVPAHNMKLNTYDTNTRKTEALRNACLWTSLWTTPSSSHFFPFLCVGGHGLVDACLDLHFRNGLLLQTEKAFYDV